jgi:hypothetical protein
MKGFQGKATAISVKDVEQGPYGMGRDNGPRSLSHQTGGGVFGPGRVWLFPWNGCVLGSRKVFSAKVRAALAKCGAARAASVGGRLQGISRRGHGDGVLPGCNVLALLQLDTQIQPRLGFIFGHSSDECRGQTWLTSAAATGRPSCGKEVFKFETRNADDFKTAK